MRSGVVFLLFGALVWGQAQMENGHSDAPQDGQASAKTAAVTSSTSTTAIAPDAAVITIDGLCGDPASKKTAPSNCKTVITRAQFEALIQLVQPYLPQADRRTFAANYAETLIRAQQAREMGLESDPRFEELMKLRREATLQFLLGRVVREKAQQVSDADIEQYYKDNRESFEEIELQELYVPAAQQIPAVGNPEEVQKRKQDSVLAMKKTAEELRTRALAGEDFTLLQADAYKAALFGGTAAPAKVEMQKQRRRNLRSAQEVSVMDLKPGEISKLFDEPNGHYIYKAGAKRALPLADVRDEILKKLRVEKLQKLQREVQQYATANFDDKYFTVTPSTSGEP